MAHELIRIKFVARMWLPATSLVANERTRLRLSRRVEGRKG
jgi:hypothetical protein